MAVSRYCIHRAHKEDEITPSFRQACEFDFFRGQAGSLFRPDIFDDGTLSEQQFKKLKAFTDVGNIESMSKERWGAAKWTKGQLCLYCVNDFVAATEPTVGVPVLAKQAGQPSYVTHSDFMKMLDVAWFQKENTESNIMAVLKRTHLLVNTKTFFYVRPASEKKQPVLRVPLGDKLDFLVEDSRIKYDFYRKGGSDLPTDFNQTVQWEAQWMKAAMQGKTGDNLPQRPIVRGRSLFSPTSPVQTSTATYSQDQVGAGLAQNLGAGSNLLPASALLHPQAPQPVPSPQPSSPPAAGVRIRRQSTFNVLKPAPGHVIDISDSPLKPRLLSEYKQSHMEVKQELHEEPSSNNKRPCTKLDAPEADVDVETESVLAAEAQALEQPMEEALEHLMDQMPEDEMDVEEAEEEEG